jgi:hypothetical protein
VADTERRIAALRVRVYGRRQDPAAVTELAELLAGTKGNVNHVPGESSRSRFRGGTTRRLRGAGAKTVTVAVAVVVLLGLAWGVGLVAGEAPHHDAAGEPKAPAAVPVAPLSTSPSRTYFLDASTGRVLDEWAATSCSGAANQRLTASPESQRLCRAASVASQRRAAAAYRAASSARAHD